MVTDLRVTLVQNRLAAALLGPAPPPTGWTGSFLYRWFTDPAARAVYPAEDHDYHTRAFVADLRAAMARRGGNDPEMTTLIAELTERSPEFTEHRHATTSPSAASSANGYCTVNSGCWTYCLNLFSEDGKQRLLWFTPAVGTDSVAKLEMLAVVGTQTLR